MVSQQKIKFVDVWIAFNNESPDIKFIIKGKSIKDKCHSSYKITCKESN